MKNRTKDEKIASFTETAYYKRMQSDTKDKG